MLNQTKQDSWARIIAKAWTDQNFKKQLMTDPRKILQEHGIDVPKNSTIHILENTENNLNLVIPTKPKGELKEEELIKMAAAGQCTCLCE